MCSLEKFVLILSGPRSCIANMPDRIRLEAPKQFKITFLSNVSCLFHINELLNSKNMLPAHSTWQKRWVRYFQIQRSIWIALYVSRIFSRFIKLEVKTANIMCRASTFVYKRILLFYSLFWKLTCSYQPTRNPAKKSGSKKHIR